MKFGKYEIKERIPPIGGRQYIINFPNGYGASIICGYPSFRCDDDTYEVAVTKNGYLCYTTPLTDDVLGYQTAEDVADILTVIERFPTALSLRNLVTWHPISREFSVLMANDRPVGYMHRKWFRHTAHVRLSNGDQKFTGRDAARNARWAVIGDMEGPL